MQQLSGMDASFLYGETQNAHMAGAGLSIYDPSTAPGGRVTFKGILEFIEERLDAAKTFRRRLVRVPFDLDHPHWIEDPDFDLEFHVRHIALPKPGDWRQLCIQAARIMARPLDLNRPLWEFYVIEGLDRVEDVPPGSFAIVSKVHHAAIDGMAGMEMTSAVHELEPDTPAAPAASEWKPERAPSAGRLLAQAAMNNTLKPMHFARVMGRSIPTVGRVQRQLRRSPGSSPLLPVPRTRWSGTVSAHRVIDGCRFPLSELRRMKRAVEGATINDVVLATVGGALRGYLIDKEELPEQSLVAMAPISVRSDREADAGGNMVSGMMTTLGTDIEDPLARLEAVRESTHRSKEFAEAVGARTLLEYAQLMPGGLVGLGARTSARLSMANRMRPIFNTTVTNMPGPQQPLYLAGAQLVSMYGIGMIVEGMGLIHPVMSYCGDLTIAFTSCREMLPDPAFYASCIRNSFEDLAKATA